MSNCLRILKTASFLAVCLVLLIPLQGRAIDFKAEVDPLAQSLLNDRLAVGFVVGIYKDGETQVISYGETEKGSAIAPDGDTIYEIGSVSKVFTGVLLADLVQRGQVKLDDPLQKYLPKTTRASLTNRSRITFEHLATHTSGLPVLPENLSPADMMNPYADYTPRQAFQFLKDYKLTRLPGEYEYSNFGMGLLGILLSSREKVPYEQLMIEQIAKPCGMNDTCIKLTDKQRERLAPPYDAALQKSKNWDIPTLAGAGGIRSTVNDMLKFIAANHAEDDQPLTKALRLSHEKRHAMEEGEAIGLAWHIESDGITRWHNGMTGGYASWVSVVPGRNAGVVVLCNTACEKITEFGQNATRITLGETIEQPAAPAVVKVSPRTLKSYEGVYAITRQFALTVKLEGDQLTVQGTGQPPLQVFPESETKFACKVIDAQITFAGEKNGKAAMLILHQNGADQVAKRQD